MTQTIIYILICINVMTFIIYGIDKWKAKKGSWRISEVTLLLLAVLGGSIGALLGMKVWHHKTMHKKFTMLLAIAACTNKPVTAVENNGESSEVAY